MLALLAGGGILGLESRTLGSQGFSFTLIHRGHPFFSSFYGFRRNWRERTLIMPLGRGRGWALGHGLSLPFLI